MFVARLSMYGLCLIAVKHRVGLRPEFRGAGENARFGR
jgi:hypothetical protein